MADPAPAHQVPQSRRLGRYEVIAQIASGGMGNVLLARLGGVAGFQRLFAIKLLHPRYATDEEFIEMLLDEARIAARIHHPNVVSIQEVCKSEAHGYYVVMDYVEGFSLADVAQMLGPPALERWRIAVRVMLDVLAGLEAAHALTDDNGVALNVVHRDLSPQNVLVGNDGVARVTDFGIAKADARMSSTSVGKVKGKLTYMAPEQVRGDVVDARTDLFAAGIVFWELLTATRLFRRDSDEETVHAVRSGRSPSARSVVPGIPGPLDKFCTQALTVAMTDRYGSAREMGLALEAVARAHDLAASAHEVAKSVRTAFAAQLTERRDAIRDTGASAERPLARLVGSLEVPLLTATVVAGRPTRTPGSTGSPTAMRATAQGTTVDPADNEPPTAPNTREHQSQVAAAIAAVIATDEPTMRRASEMHPAAAPVAVDPEQDEDPTQLTSPESKAAILAALAAEGGKKGPPRPSKPSIAATSPVPRVAVAAKKPAAARPLVSPRAAPSSPVSNVPVRKPTAPASVGAPKDSRAANGLDDDVPTDQSDAGLLHAIVESLAIQPERGAVPRSEFVEPQPAAPAIAANEKSVDPDDAPTSIRHDFVARVVPREVLAGTAPAHIQYGLDPAPVQHHPEHHMPAPVMLEEAPAKQPRYPIAIVFNTITALTVALIVGIVLARNAGAVRAAATAFWHPTPAGAAQTPPALPLPAALPTPVAPGSESNSADRASSEPSTRGANESQTPSATSDTAMQTPRRTVGRRRRAPVRQRRSTGRR